MVKTSSARELIEWKEVGREKPDAESHAIVNVDDLRKLVNLARELSEEVRRLEGQTPSSEMADAYFAETIAKVAAEVTA